MLPINEHYFNRDSRAVYYVLGAFYACYHAVDKAGFEFRSPHRDLVEIVKRQMGSEHTTISDNREKSSYWFEAKGRPKLHSRLGSLGLNAPKKERRFPEDVDRKYISHFVRGFLDARSNLSNDDGMLSMDISFNPMFLVRLNQILGEYAKVQKPDPTGKYTNYHHGDCLRICDFIYEDWGFIQRNGLYLPLQKDLFTTDRPPHIRVAAASKKIEEAEKMLKEGLHPAEVSRRLGYAFHPSFARAFKQKTGMTASQFRMQNQCKQT